MKAFKLLVVSLISACILAQQPGSEHRLANSLQQKLDYIQRNGKRAHPDPRPTVMTEEEINDYLASGSNFVDTDAILLEIALQGRTTNWIT